MADQPFIDTHVHFWDHSVEGLEWAWLKEGYTFRRWKGSDSLDAPRYSAPEFRAESEGAGVAAIVHVHAAHPIDDPARETEWLESVAAEHGVPQAIVGACSLGDPDASDILRRHARHPRFRGVRDAWALKHLVVDEIVAAMDVAEELGISVELRRSHDQFAELEEVATRWAGVTVALSHGCLPLERNADELATWSAAMKQLARHRNVVCKISAVGGASDPEWTPASIRPWILSCIDTFGADRCLFGSNWPVDRLFGTYRGLVDAYREVTAELSSDEQAAVFHRTAERVYGIDPLG